MYILPVLCFSMKKKHLPILSPHEPLIIWHHCWLMMHRPGQACAEEAGLAFRCHLSMEHALSTHHLAICLKLFGANMLFGATGVCLNLTLICSCVTAPLARWWVERREAAGDILSVHPGRYEMYIYFLCIVSIHGTINR